MVLDHLVANTSWPPSSEDERPLLSHLLGTPLTEDDIASVQPFYDDISDNTVKAERMATEAGWSAPGGGGTSAWFGPCVTRRVATVVARFAPVFAYRFARTGNGSFTSHGDALPFLFQSEKYGRDVLEWGGQDPDLMTTVGAYMTAFAHTYDPNMARGGASTKWGALPTLRWPLYNATSDAMMLLNTPQPVIEAGYRADACAQWQAIGEAHVGTDLKEMPLGLPQAAREGRGGADTALVAPVE
jgi:carboxylesterase type B